MLTQSEKEAQQQIEAERKLARTKMEKCLREGKYLEATDHAWRHGWLPEVRAAYAVSMKAAPQEGGE